MSVPVQAKLGPYRNPTQVYDGPQYDATIGGNLYQWVAWHRGGAATLVTGKRHLRVHGMSTTLCGARVGKGRTRVSPGADRAPGSGYWHTGDCKNCLRAAAKAAT